MASGARSERRCLVNLLGKAKGAASTASFTGYKLYSGLPIFRPYYYEDVGYSASILAQIITLSLVLIVPVASKWYGFVKADRPNQADAFESNRIF